MYPNNDFLESIYYSDGVPITLYEIIDWWSNAPFDVKNQFKDPKIFETHRKDIAHQIVLSIKQKLGSNYKSFENEINKKEKENLNSFLNVLNKKSSTNNITPNIQNKKLLNNIVSDDPSSHFGKDSIFQQAMKMAQEKIRQQQFNYNKQYQHKYRPPDKTIDIPQLNWRKTLEFSDTQVVTKSDLIKRFRELAHKYHPDHGGSPKKMQDIIQARDEAIKEVS